METRKEATPPQGAVRPGWLLEYGNVLTVVFAVVLIFNSLFDVEIFIQPRWKSKTPFSPIASLEMQVLPPEGVALPVRWGNLGAKMVETGVIDKEKIESLYMSRGGLNDEEKKILYGSDNEKVEINEKTLVFF